MLFRSRAFLAQFLQQLQPVHARHLDVADRQIGRIFEQCLQRDEYRAGTELNNPNSYLRVDIQVMNNMANILVAAVSNRTYTVQYSEVLPASWNKLADLIARATNRVEAIKDPNWTTNRFYRIALPAQ